MPLTRKIIFIPAYDKGPQYGIHGMVIGFQLSGPEGVLVWDFHTGIYLEQTKKRLGQRNNSSDSYGTEIYSHSTKPHPDSTEGTEHCDLIGGVKCYTTSIYGGHLSEILLGQGDAPIWEELEKQYQILWPQLELSGI